MKKHFLTILLLFYVVVNYAQVDPLYSQYMFNQLALNPAYAGSREVMSIYGLSRNQWTGIGDGAPRTQLLTIHSPVPNRKIGLGLQLMADQIGPQKNAGAFASYAYRIRLKNSRLAMGIRLGTYTYKYDQSAIQFKDPSEYSSLQLKESHVTADFGVYYNSQSWYWGVSIFHLVDINTSRSSYYPTVHRYLTVGKAFQVSDNLIINPSILLKGTDNSKSIDINANFLIKQKLWLGLSVRNRGTIPFLIEYVVSEKLKIGFSHDFPFGDTRKSLGGANELLLQWDITVRKTKTLSPRYL